MTLATAENLLEEGGMNPFFPQVNNRLDTDGITGMHFPLYELGLAFVWKIFGQDWHWHRWYALLITALGAIGMALWVKEIFPQSVYRPTLALWMYLFSPQLFYDGFIALPDPLALGAACWGLYFFWLHRRSGKNTWLVAAIFWLLVAGLVKLQYLGAGFLVAGSLIANRKHLITKDWIKYGFVGVGIVLPVMAWYKRSGDLIKKSGLADIGLEMKPAESLNKGLSTLAKNIYSDLPELLLGYVSFIGLLVFVYLLIKKRYLSSYLLLWPFLLFTFGFVVYHILELRVLEHHQYYMLPYLLVLIPAAACGWEHLIKKKSITFWLFFLLMPVMAAARIIPARFAGPLMLEKELYIESERAAVQKLIPEQALVITGPDESMCIYHYYLQTKGWSYSSVDELFKVNNSGISLITEANQRGAKVLIFNGEDEDMEQFEDNLDRMFPENELLGSVGNFKVYALQAQP